MTKSGATDLVVIEVDKQRGCNGVSVTMLDSNSFDKRIASETRPCAAYLLSGGYRLRRSRGQRVRQRVVERQRRRWCHRSLSGMKCRAVQPGRTPAGAQAHLCVADARVANCIKEHS